jgi:GDP-L-fucose synthase
MHNKILVTGGSGMVGRSLKKYLPSATYVSSKDYNLTTREGIQYMLIKERPDVVIHLAARVGGIIDNIKYPADYFDQNVLMNTQLIKYSYLDGVKRFIGVLSTCAYPDVIPNYPMVEQDLHSGPPALTNFSYGYSKRSMAVQIDAYNKQYNTKYQYLIPCNLYGEFDKYGDNSHFIAALIKKIHNAKVNNEDKITLFGDGSPLRQFMHSDDLAFVIDYCIKNEIYDNINVINNNIANLFILSNLLLLSYTDINIVIFIIISNKLVILLLNFHSIPLDVDACLKSDRIDLYKVNAAINPVIYIYILLIGV